MNKYNITVTDPTFYTAFAEFCEENKDACVEFLQGNMEFIPSAVDRTPKFDDLLTTHRVFLQLHLKREFENEFPYEESSNLNNRSELMNNFVRNKISMLAETQTIEKITLYRFDKNQKSALTAPSSLQFDNTTPVATSKNFDGLKLDGSSLAMKDKPSPQPVKVDSDMKFNNNVEIENKSLLESIKSSISKFLNKNPDALDLKNNTNKPK